MIVTILAKTTGYLAYYSLYWTYRAIYSMLTADPAAIAMALLL